MASAGRKEIMDLASNEDHYLDHPKKDRFVDFQAPRTNNYEGSGDMELKNLDKKRVMDPPSQSPIIKFVSSTNKGQNDTVTTSTAKAGCYK